MVDFQVPLMISFRLTNSFRALLVDNYCESKIVTTRDTTNRLIREFIYLLTPNCLYWRLWVAFVTVKFSVGFIVNTLYRTI